MSPGAQAPACPPVRPVSARGKALGPVEGSGGEDRWQVQPRTLALPDTNGSVSGISPAPRAFPRPLVPSKVLQAHFAEFSQLPAAATKTTAITLLCCEKRDPENSRGLAGMQGWGWMGGGAEGPASLSPLQHDTAEPGEDQLCWRSHEARRG